MKTLSDFTGPQLTASSVFLVERMKMNLCWYGDMLILIYVSAFSLHVSSFFANSNIVSSCGSWAYWTHSATLSRYCCEGRLISALCWRIWTMYYSQWTRLLMEGMFICERILYNSWTPILPFFRAVPDVVVPSFFGFSSIIMESDPQLVASRVSLRGAEGDVPLSEQTISQVRPVCWPLA